MDNVVVAPRSLRTWWIYTIIANAVGIAILLIGGIELWALLTLGIIVLVVSFWGQDHCTVWLASTPTVGVSPNKLPGR